MTDQQLSKKSTPIIIIAITTIIFMMIGYGINKKTPENWLVKYKINLNERGLIYLNAIDKIVVDLGVQKKMREIHLSRNVTAVIIAQDELLSSTIPGISRVVLLPESLIYNTPVNNNFDEKTDKMMKIVNDKIQDDLLIRLNLYYEIAKETMDEENKFYIKQIEKVELMNLIAKKNRALGENNSPKNKYLKLDNLVNFFIFNGVNEQKAEISDLENFLADNSTANSPEDISKILELLRKKYESASLEDNLLLIRLGKMMARVSEINFLEVSYYILHINKKPTLFFTIATAAFAGLVTSTFSLYTYFLFRREIKEFRLRNPL